MNAIWPEHLHGRIKRLFAEDDYLWCQDVNAKDEEGNACRWQDEDACEFCLLGAVYKVYHGSRHWPLVCAYLAQIFQSGFWEGLLLTWNDVPDRTYSQVIGFLDRYRL